MVLNSPDVPLKISGRRRCKGQVKANSSSGEPASRTGHRKPAPAQQGTRQGASAELWQEHTPEGVLDHQDPKTEQCQILLLAPCPIPPLSKAFFGKRSLAPSSRHLDALIRFPLSLHHLILPSLWTSYQRGLDLFHRNDGQVTWMTSHIPAQASSNPGFHYLPVRPSNSYWKHEEAQHALGKYTVQSQTCLFRGVSERKQNKSLLSVGVVEAALQTSLKYTIIC